MDVYIKDIMIGNFVVFNFFRFRLILGFVYKINLDY